MANLWRSFSVPGLLLGLLFLCASLTPSLLPRIPAVQGTLSGVSLAVGYGLGKALHWAWLVMGFSNLSGWVRQALTWGLTLGLAGLTIFTFHRSTIWQNSIRQRMEMPDVESGYSLLVAAIALGLALVLILVARGVIWLMLVTSRPLNWVLPRPTAIGLGAVIAVMLVAGLVNGFIVQTALRAADEVFATLDLAIEDDIAAPPHAFASGGPASVIDWDDIGTKGKAFLIDGPSQAEISALTGRPAMEPIRVYAGYRSGETFEERAALALRDLIALGGFERSVLIVATPTGTGWLDPAAVQPIAYLHGGDLAIVAAQYAYVPSWMSIMVEPDRSRLAAQALFDAVYGHWTRLPEDNRPEFYLFGVSLGALGSEASADLISIFADPIDGAFWSGPPFASYVWASVVARRNPGTPARLPEFRDGSVVRFMNQDGIATPAGAEWGPMRVIYLQYASDPMVFFSPSLAVRRPDWLSEERGRDVSPFFNWYPFVTFLQVGFDVPMATSPPSGYGHTYDALDYIEGWIAVTQPADWSAGDTEKLKALFAGFTASANQSNGATWSRQRSSSSPGL